MSHQSNHCDFSLHTANLISYLFALKFNRKKRKICCSCDSLWPFMLRSASTNSLLSFNRGKPTSGSLRQWTSMHGTCTQLLPDLYQITTCDGHCWHCVESRGYPGRIKTALAAVYYQQSPALASWPTKHTAEADRGKKKKKRPWGQGLIVDVHDDASCLQC